MKKPQLLDYDKMIELVGPDVYEEAKNYVNDFFELLINTTSFQPDDELIETLAFYRDSAHNLSIRYTDKDFIIVKFVKLKGEFIALPFGFFRVITEKVLNEYDMINSKLFNDTVYHQLLTIAENETAKLDTYLYYLTAGLIYSFGLFPEDTNLNLINGRNIIIDGIKGEWVFTDDKHDDFDYEEVSYILDVHMKKPVVEVTKLFESDIPGVTTDYTVGEIINSILNDFR